MNRFGSALAALAVLFAAVPALAQTEPGPAPDPSAPLQPPPQPPPSTPATPPPATPEPAPQHDAWGGMSAGGVTPPAPVSAPPPPSSAEKPLTPDKNVDSDLDESKKKDSGRGLSWFWVEVEGGFEHVGLHTFNVDETALSAGLVATEASGGVIDAGVGAQLVFVTIGARARMGFFSDWQIGRIGGELGFRIPIGFIEPRFDLGGGYAALGSFDGVVAEDVSIRGFYLRAGAGLDFYPLKWLSLGGHATFDFMGLTRPGLDPTQIADLTSDPSIGDLSAAQQQALAVDGSGYGASFALQGSIGLHF